MIRVSKIRCCHFIEAPIYLIHSDFESEIFNGFPLIPFISLDVQKEAHIHQTRIDCLLLLTPIVTQIAISSIHHYTHLLFKSIFEKTEEKISTKKEKFSHYPLL
jgi:hypothetical protein